LHERKHAFLHNLLLILLVLGGLSLRLTNVNFDRGHFAHPDERHIIMVIRTFEKPARWLDLLDPHRSTMNPFWRPGSDGQRQPMSFAYGHFPLYLLMAVSSGLQALSRPLSAFLGAGNSIVRELSHMTDHLHMTLTGRVLSALFDTGTVLLVYALARRLYGRWGGLLAAGLLSFTVIHIQLAHFYAVDTVLALFVVLTLYWLVRVAQGEGRKAAILAGVSMALAAASKTSAAPLALPWLVAFLLRGRRNESRETARLAIESALAAAITFVLVSPYVLLDLRMFLESIAFESKMVRGTYDLPYTRQYRGTPAYVYPILQQLRWGMGWVSGAVACLGCGWACWRFARKIATDGETVLLAWCLPYFLITGGFMVKFMRYMAPLIPLMLVLGVGMLSCLYRRHYMRAVVIGVAVLALVYALAWSWAFTAIYRRPFTRHEASIWIYRHIPRGAIITKEEWDDLIPYDVIVDGEVRSAGRDYQILTFPLQEPDNLAKVEMLVDRLSRADYIIISSNRFYGWLPRLRDRFPVSNRYYELLFSGELGFELRKTFSSYPTLGPWQFPDDNADESFTVYDHPKVMIFERVRSLSEDELRALFVEALYEDGQEDRALLLPSPVDQYPSVRDFAWTSWTGDGLGAALWWWLVGSVLALTCWPLTQLMFSQLWAMGWPFARLVGLLLIAYPVWLGASVGFARNTRQAFVAIGLLLLALNVVVGICRREAFVSSIRNRWRQILAAEALALFAYCFFIGIRLLNPDIWHPWWGGERPMEMGFLLAIMRSGRFPPYDPFYAGGYINYYYYGLYLVGMLIKLSGIGPDVAFNLALALFYSLTVGAVGVLGASLAPRRKGWAAIWAVLLVGVLGNPEGGLQLIRRWGELGDGAWGQSLPLIGWFPRLVNGLLRVLSGSRGSFSYDFWGPTRVIPDTINEFPFFSFLYGDLHPHILDMPLVLMGLGVAYCTYRTLASGGRMSWSEWSGLGLYALLCGTAIVTNAWDVALLVAVMAGVALLVGRRRGGAGALRGVAMAGALAVVGAILYGPFLLWYESPAKGVGLTQAGSPVLHFLRVWGLFLWLSLVASMTVIGKSRFRRGPVGYIGVMLRRWRRMPRLLDLTDRSGELQSQRRRAFAVVLVVLLVTLVLVAARRGAAALCILPLSLCLVAAWIGPRNEHRFACGLAALAWAVLLGTEVFFLKDWLAGGSAYRMNTVFKFGIQSWLLLGVSCGAQLWSVSAGRTGRASGRHAVTVALLGLCAVYSILGTSARVGDRFPNGHPPVGTLDGLAFMETGEYFWPDETNRIVLAYEREALRWLRENVVGTRVVAEAALGYYREGGSRVAAYTGLPIPLGPQHEAEQRPYAPLGQRSASVRRLYETTDAEEAFELLRRLGVSYVYLGQLERIAYGEDGVPKFENLVSSGRLSAPFRNDRVTIYAVP